MSILINAQNLSKSFSAKPLFRDVSFVVESGERVGLIGPNGAGKSTLLRILASQLAADEGSVSTTRGLRVAYLEQVPRFAAGMTVLSTLLESEPATNAARDWEKMELAREIMAKLSLNQGAIGPDTLIESLSGGWKKRVAMARELVRQPDLLLLDEPTNHLDVESILWLEQMLERASFATITITHDRLFLQRVSNRILELDRRHPDGLLSVKGDYSVFLEVRAELMEIQERTEVSLRNKLRRETEWLRRGAKARTTKQQARIQRAEALSKEVEDLGERNSVRKARLDFTSSDRKPKRLIEAKGVAKAYGGRELFSNLDLFVGPTSRIGLLGANGCGKSTLLRVLLGKEPADTGYVFLSERLSVAYFEQNRDTLDPTRTVWKTLCPGGDHVIYRGTSVHIRGYLDRFLFTPEQAEVQVGKLSGGEQSRLLIAKLMLSEANVLVLDEPTNDLDIATLDVLQDCLQEFDGAVLLVTHDRYFLDQVTNEVLAFPSAQSPDRRVLSFADLDQWENWREKQQREERNRTAKVEVERDPIGARKRKLGYNELRELQGMESRILMAEKALEQTTAEAQCPENISDAAKLTELYQRMAQYQAEIERLYARWAELDGMRDP